MSRRDELWSATGVWGLLVIVPPKEKSVLFLVSMDLVSWRWKEYYQTNYLIHCVDEEGDTHDPKAMKSESKIKLKCFISLS